MKAYLTILIVILFLASPDLAAAQVKEPTLRDRVRQNGFVWDSSYPEDRTLATFDILVARSDLIILGRVVDERTRLSSSEDLVRTDYTIQVLEVFKGGQELAAGKRLVVSKDGGNILLEGKPVRVDTPNFPPVPWIAPHLFFIKRSEHPEAQYYFTGAGIGVFRTDRGKLHCDGPERARHPATNQFCGKTLEEVLPLLKDKIASPSGSIPRP